MADRITFADLNPVMQGMLVILTMVAIIIPCVLGFVSFDKRLDIVEDGQEKHIISDEKRYEKVVGDLDENSDAIHALQLVDKGLTIQYGEILRRIEENGKKLDNLERAE